MTWTTLLAKTELATDLSPSEIEAFLALFKELVVKAGKTIFEEESRGRDMYLLCKGRVNIVMRGLTAGDERIVVNEVAPGQVFGEFALVDGAPRSADARAVTDCTLLALAEPVFAELALQQPRLGYVVMRNLARTLSGRLRTTNFQLRNNRDWVSILGNL